VELTNSVNHSDEMNKKSKVDWWKIDGSSPKPKRLHFKKAKQIACITVQYRCEICTVPEMVPNPEINPESTLK